MSQVHSVTVYNYLSIFLNGYLFTYFNKKNVTKCWTISVCKLWPFNVNLLQWNTNKHIVDGANCKILEMNNIFRNNRSRNGRKNSAWVAQYNWVFFFWKAAMINLINLLHVRDSIGMNTIMKWQGQFLGISKNFSRINS